MCTIFANLWALSERYSSLGYDKTHCKPLDLSIPEQFVLKRVVSEFFSCNNFKVWRLDFLMKGSHPLKVLLLVISFHIKAN